MLQEACPSCNRSETEPTDIYQCEHCGEPFCYTGLSNGIEGCLEQFVVYGMESALHPESADTEWERERGKFFCACPWCDNWMMVNFGHFEQENLVPIDENPEMYIENQVCANSDTVRSLGIVRNLG